MLKVYKKLYKFHIPFYTLDNFIKTKKSMQKIYEQPLRALSFYLYERNFFTSAFGNSYKFYFVSSILPKIIFLSLFIMDIFYFHKFYLIYSALFLGIIPLIKAYIIYSIKQLIEKDIQYIEYNYYIKLIDDEEELPEGVWYYLSIKSLPRDEDGFINLRYFLELQVAAIQFNVILYKYACVETWEARVAYAKEHDLYLAKTYAYEPASDEISIGLSKKFYELMPQIIHMLAFVKCDRDMSINPRIKGINMIIISIYLFCWVYILIISLHTLQDMSLICNILELMAQYSVIEEPFSNTFLEDYENKFK